MKDITVVYYANTHYSIFKALDLLNLKGIKIAVDQTTRDILFRDFEQKKKLLN